MTKILVTLLVIAILGLSHALARATTPSEKFADYFPLRAAPEQHKTIFENDFVLVLDVSIPPGVTVPAHLHPWPAVFITPRPSHLVFRNLAGEVVREIRPPITPLERPQVEWREPDAEPASVANVGREEQRALRIELKTLGR